MRIYLSSLLFITTLTTSAQIDFQSVSDGPDVLNPCRAKQNLLKQVYKKQDLRTYFLTNFDESQASWNVLNSMSMASSSLAESTSFASPSESVDLMSYLITNYQSISPLTTSSKHCSNDLQTLFNSYTQYITSEQKSSFYKEVNTRVIELKMCYEEYSQYIVDIIGSLDADIEKLTIKVNNEECK